MKNISKKNGEEDIEVAPSRWQRRERKAKPRMRVHGRRIKELARRLSEKKIGISAS
jgi:hypothetical protein